METARTEAKASSGTPRSSLAAWVALGVLALLAAGLIVYMGRGLTFFRDEWIFVLYRDGHDSANFLSSHAGHLLLWPTGFFVFMFKAVGLDHYQLYVLAALPLHLACALLLYLLARPRIGDVLALAPAVILLFLGSAWMDLLWPFQIAFTGALAFGLAAILLLELGSLWGDALVCAALVVALGWSGVALPFIPGVAVGLLLRRRFWRRLWVAAVPGILYLAWQAKYGTEGIDTSELAEAPEYLIHMVGAGMTGISGLPDGWGPALAILAAVIVAIRLWSLGRSSPLAWEAVAMGAVFWGLTAMSRVQYQDPGANRYIYPSAVFLLLIAIGIAPARAPRRAISFTVLALVALTLPSNISDLQQGRDELRLTANITSAELGAIQLARGVVPPEYTPPLHGFAAVPSAAFFFATDRYGSSPADSPGEIASSPEYARKQADLVSIRALGVSLESPPRQLRLVPVSPVVQSAGEQRRDGPCVALPGGDRVEAEVLVPSAGVLLRSGPGAPVRVSLRRFARSLSAPLGSIPAGEERILRPARDLDPGAPWHARLESAHGPVAVCGLAP